MLLSPFFPSATASIATCTTLPASIAVISRCHLCPSVATSPTSQCSAAITISSPLSQPHDPAAAVLSPLFRHRPHRCCLSLQPPCFCLYYHPLPQSHDPFRRIATPLEASLAAHNSVATASDRHIPLKGCRLRCLVYHSAAFNSSSNSHTLLYRNRRLYPVALYLSFSLLLPSSRTAATTASFSLLATITIAQPCPRQPWITAASAAPHANVAAF
ncbi:hypothetical protein B296_00025090 [Ensete ventricosum]|uniref:Uncharacterized protein n=1 Tax=Ensete ventricosum TaxID=4639 RepID=A0A426YM51_ENSVE|nr:hypothetical protein B296_00025090 [Ensete ventricosum]